MCKTEKAPGRSRGLFFAAFCGMCSGSNSECLLSRGPGFEPGGQVGVAALPSEICCGLSGVAFLVRVCAVGEEEFGQILPVGCGGREEGSESSGLGGVGVGAVLEQEVDRLDIATKGESGVERLVLLGVAAEGIDTGCGVEEGGDGLG